MEALKVTFDRELTFEGKTFEKEAIIGAPKDGQYFLYDGGVTQAEFDFTVIQYPILTQKKKVYTVIKVEGVHPFPGVWSNAEYVENVSVQTVEE